MIDFCSRLLLETLARWDMKQPKNGASLLACCCIAQWDPLAAGVKEYLLSKEKIPLTAIVTGKPSDPEKNYVIKGIKETWSPLTF